LALSTKTVFNTDSLGPQSEKDVVNGLKAGADDYLKKPFGMQEFMARVEVLTRRLGSRAAPLHLDYGQLKIDLAQRRVQFRGEYIELTPQEFSLSTF